MTESTTEVRTTTTTTVIDSKNGDVGHPVRLSKKTVTDDLYTTFSSPMAWLLVLALIITWSAVAVIMFDLMDYKGLTAYTFYCDDPCLPPGPRPVGVSNAIKEAERPRGGIEEIGSDPMKVVNDAMEESTDWMNAIFTFVSDLLAPEEDDDEGDPAISVRKKGEFLPSKKKEPEAIKTKKEKSEKKTKDEMKEPEKEIKKSKAAKEEEKKKKLEKPEKKIERAKKAEKAVEKAKPKAKPKAEKRAKAEIKGKERRRDGDGSSLHRIVRVRQRGDMKRDKKPHEFLGKRERMYKRDKIKRHQLGA